MGRRLRKDPYPESTKSKALQRVASGNSVASAAKRLGITRSAVGNWVTEAGGAKALRSAPGSSKRRLAEPDDFIIGEPDEPLGPAIGPSVLTVLRSVRDRARGQIAAYQRFVDTLTRSIDELAALFPPAGNGSPTTGEHDEPPQLESMRREGT